MSSIRKRLSQIWRRSSSEKETPKGPEQSPVAHRDSISSLDSGYSSITSQRAPDSTKSSTPRNLHKVASMTFQSFSDTIRSKTRVFYVSPEKADAKSVDHTEDPPESHQPRSSILLSSAKSWEGPNSLDDQLDSGRSSPTPMRVVTNFQEMTPTINVKIPNSFLADSETSEDSTYDSSVEMSFQAATPKPYGSRQLWPSPIDVALQQFSKIDLSATGVPRSPMIDDPCARSSEDFMYDSAMFDPVSRITPAVPEAQNLIVEDNRGKGDLHNEGMVTEPRSPANASGSPSRPMPNVDAVMKKQQLGDSFFFKEGRVYFQRADSTLTFLEPAQKDAVDAGVASEALDSSLPLIPAEMSSPYSNTTERSIRVFNRTVSRKTGLKDLVAASNSYLNQEGQGHRTRQTSSSVYEADQESEEPSPEVPAMGSRREWDKVRADRYSRYSAIRFLDDDEKTEEDSDFGIELEKAPARRPLEDAVHALTEPSTNKNSQGVDLIVANDEMADLKKKTPESPRKLVLHTVETTSTNSSELSLGLSEESHSSLALSDLYQEFDAHEWPSPAKSVMAGYVVDAEAALHRLTESKKDWSGLSSYDSEDELYIQDERPGDVTSFPAALEPTENDQECKNARTEEQDLGSTLSAHQSEVFDEPSTVLREEMDPYGYYSLGSGVVWSHLPQMDAPGGTKFLDEDASEGDDERIEGILSDDECSPLDESSVYINPSPFPDLKKDSIDEEIPSSVITEHSLTDQVDRIALLDKQEADPAPISPSISVNSHERFWTDLVLDLKDYSVVSQAVEQNAQNQGDLDPKGSRKVPDGLMIDLDEMMREIKYELDDPDRAFNAARLPRFNSIPAPALQSLAEVQRRSCEGCSPGLIGIKKENKTTSTGRDDYQRSGQKKRPVNMVGWSSNRPQNRRDRTSPGKKGVWWAKNIEYIEKCSSPLTEKSNEVKQETGRPKLSSPIPAHKVPKKLPYRPRKSGDVENRSGYVTERGEH